MNGQRSQFLSKQLYTSDARWVRFFESSEVLSTLEGILNRQTFLIFFSLMHHKNHCENQQVFFTNHHKRDSDRTKWRPWY